MVRPVQQKAEIALDNTNSIAPGDCLGYWDERAEECTICVLVSRCQEEKVSRIQADKMSAISTAAKLALVNQYEKRKLEIPRAFCQFDTELRKLYRIIKHRGRTIIHYKYLGAKLCSILSPVSDDNIIVRLDAHKNRPSDWVNDPMHLLWSRDPSFPGSYFMFVNRSNWKEAFEVIKRVHKKLAAGEVVVTVTSNPKGRKTRKARAPALDDAQPSKTIRLRGKIKTVTRASDHKEKQTAKGSKKLKKGKRPSRVRTSKQKRKRVNVASRGPKKDE